MIQINDTLHHAIIQLNDDDNCTIQVLNAFGALVEVFTIQQQQLTIDLSKYAKGNYSIKLETNQQTFLKNIEIK